MKSAVLLVASAHLNYTLPKDHPARLPVLHHFASALSGLRLALAEEINASNVESIIGCSILLAYYSWSRTEWDSTVETDVTIPFLEILAFLQGIKDCVLVVYSIWSIAGWSKVMTYRPKIAMQRYVLQSQGQAGKCRILFDHCLHCGLRTIDDGNASDDNVKAMDRLILAFEVIKISHPDLKGSGCFHDVVRYLFTWPTFCTRGFAQQVKERNPVSMTILLYYYAAIVYVFPDEIWWAKERAQLMFDGLRLELEGRCDICTGPAIDLCNSKVFKDRKDLCWTPWLS